MLFGFGAFCTRLAFLIRVSLTHVSLEISVTVHTWMTPT